MSIEPQRDIEKTLLAYAHKRRHEAGPPREMSGVTRHLLQAEAARCAPRLHSTLQSQPSTLWSFLQRHMAFACAVLLLAAVGLVFATVHGHRKPATLALNDRRKDSLHGTRQEQAKAAAAAAPAPLALPPQSAAAVNMAVTPGIAVTQQFSRVILENQSSTSAKLHNGQGMLDSFRFEQVGGRLRVVDSDGSVYHGFIQRPADLLAQTRPSGGLSARDADSLNQPAASAAAPAEPPVASYYFQVTGTNRSLHKTVYFSGNLSGAQVHGHAVLGGKNQMKVNATPAKQ